MINFNIAFKTVLNIPFLISHASLLCIMSVLCNINVAQSVELLQSV